MSEPAERFYPPLAVGDESHTFTDAEFRARLKACVPIPPRGQPEIPEFARVYLNRMVESSPNPPAFIDEAVRRQADADFAKREAEARAAIVVKVREAVERAVDDGPLGDASGHLGGGGFQAIAEAAVDVFVELLRNPPVREHHDGYEVVRWPGGEDDVIARYPADEAGPLDEYRGQ